MDYGKRYCAFSCLRFFSTYWEDDENYCVVYNLRLKFYTGWSTAVLQPSEVHRAARACAWVKQRIWGCKRGIDQNKQKNPQILFFHNSFVMAEIETNNNNKRLLKELKSDTTAVCFQWHVFWEWKRAEEVNVSHFSYQTRLTDPLTSFGWHCAVPFAPHTRGREGGAVHSSQDEITVSA